MTYSISPHAGRQAEGRGIAPAEVVSIVAERLAGQGRRESWAVLCGYAEGGGWQGASAGDVVWAIVRGECVVTVMYRRNDQPSTPAALRVEGVVA